MKTQISPMLAVSDGNAAIAFYKASFGATLLWPPRWWACAAPTRWIFTTVRIGLFVDDPGAVHRRALAAGAVERNPVEEHTLATIGRHPIGRMLQGALVDPFGHLWLVGKFLD